MTDIKILDVGCGAAKTPGAVGVDRWPAPGVDVVADMENACLPFCDGVFDEARLIDSLEHAASPPAVVGEVARVLKPGGRLFARVPHYTSVHAWSDFTHKSFFSVESLKHLTGEYEEYRHYSSSRMALGGFRIRMWKGWRLLGLEVLANAAPGLYEKYFAFTFPAMALEFTLVKSG